MPHMTPDGTDRLLDHLFRNIPSACNEHDFGILVRGVVQIIERELALAIRRERKRQAETLKAQAAMEN